MQIKLVIRWVYNRGAKRCRGNERGTLSVVYIGVFHSLEYNIINDICLLGNKFSRDTYCLLTEAFQVKTSVNMAKIKALEKGTVPSIASVKVLCHNLFLYNDLFPC